MTEVGPTYSEALPALEKGLDSYRAVIHAGLEGVLSEFYLLGRVKGARSIARKMRPNAEAARTWESITDKIGLRVITWNRAELKRADVWLQSSGLAVVEREVKRGKTDRLYYPGVHFLVLDPTVLDADGAPLPCEVQLRTRAQDAWSVVSHKLLYKGLVRPSRRVRRVVARLTIVVEMFDDEVHRIFRKRSQMPEYRSAAILEHLADQYTELTGEVESAPLPLDLIVQLDSAFGGSPATEIASTIDTFVADNRSELIRVLTEHAPLTRTYDPGRDWIFAQPEVLAILERATTRPHMLLNAIADSDLEASVRRACLAFGVTLPQTSA